MNTRIADINTSIGSQIIDLDEKLDTVLEKNEKDFLTAYRFHMLQVQNELMQLKKKANESELQSLQDSKLAELEREVNQYQTQCMDLRKHCDTQEKQIKQLGQDKHVMLNDADFLDFQLRDGKEQNASLKLELSRLLTKMDDQNLENESARNNLRQFITNFNMSINDDTNLVPIGESVLMDFGDIKPNQASFISGAGAKGQGVHTSGMQGSLMEKNTAVGDSMQQRLQGSLIGSSAE